MGAVTFSDGTVYVPVGTYILNGERRIIWKSSERYYYS